MQSAATTTTMLLQATISATFTAYCLLVSALHLACASEFAPYFAAEPISQYANVGDQVTLQCDARWPSSTNEPTIFWFRNGSLMQPARSAVRRGILELRVKSESDFAKYQCLVRFGDSGSLFSRVAYIVRSPWPSMRAQEANLTHLSVPPGNIAVIPCGETLRPGVLLAGYEFQYDLENGSVPMDEQHFVTSSGNLMMVMKSSRVGVYRCRVQAPGGATVFQRWFDLRLQPSDQRSPARLVRISPLQVSVRQEDNVTLECVYHGSPVPSNRWEMYEREEKRPKMVGDSDRRLRFGNLHIVNASTSDEARYVCLGDNTGKGIAAVAGNRVINLKVLPRLDQPHILVHSLSSLGERRIVASRGAPPVTISADERITLSCVTNSKDSRDVVWLFNGNASISNTVRTSRNLTIVRFERALHQGVYQCFMDDDSTLQSVHATVLLFSSSEVDDDASALIVRRPQNATTGLGQATAFLCAVQSAVVGDGSAQVSWLRNGKHVDRCDEPGASRVCVAELELTQFALHIFDAQLHDAGKYTCAVELANRLDSADVWLVVDLRPPTADVRLVSTSHKSTSVRHTIANTNALTMTASTRIATTQLSKSALASSLSTAAGAVHTRAKAQSNQSNNSNEFSARTRLDDGLGEAGPAPAPPGANPLKALTENAFYLITLIACGVALLVCTSIVLVALVRRRRRCVRKPAAPGSFSRRVDLVPVGIVYNKLSQAESTPLANSCRPLPPVQHAQVNPYASTPLCTASFPRIDMPVGSRFAANGAYFAPPDTFSYVSVAQRSTRPCSFGPEQLSTPDTDTCSEDEEWADAASPRKRVKYSADAHHHLAHDLQSFDAAANDPNLPNSYLCSTLNRNKLTAVRKYSTLSARSPSLAHSFSANRNNTLRHDECLHNPALASHLANLPSNFNI